MSNDDTGRLAEDALARIVAAQTIAFDFNRNVARAILASDWLAARVAAARAEGWTRGVEDMAEAVSAIGLWRWWIRSRVVSRRPAE